MARIADLLAAGRTFSFEFFPPEDRRRPAHARSHDRRARAAAPRASCRSPTAPAAAPATHPRGGRVDRARRRRSRRWPTSRARATPRPRSARSSTTTAPPASRTSSPSAAMRPNDPADARAERLRATPSSWSSDVRRRDDGFSIGVAAHPEVHPRSPSRDDRPPPPRREAARVADFAITQFFFEAEHYLRLVDELAALGVRQAGASRGSCRSPTSGQVAAHGRAERRGLPGVAGRAARRGRPTTRTTSAASVWRPPPSCAPSCSTPARRACTSTR